jgi:hypothetical protein
MTARAKPPGTTAAVQTSRPQSTSDSTSRTSEAAADWTNPHSAFKTRIPVPGEIGYYEYADGRFLRRAEDVVRQTVSAQLAVLQRINPGVNGR